MVLPIVWIVLFALSLIHWLTSAFSSCSLASLSTHMINASRPAGPIASYIISFPVPSVTDRTYTSVTTSYVEVKTAHLGEHTLYVRFSHSSFFRPRQSHCQPGIHSWIARVGRFQCLIYILHVRIQQDSLVQPTLHRFPNRRDRFASRTPFLCLILDHLFDPELGTRVVVNALALGPRLEPMIGSSTGHAVSGSRDGPAFADALEI